MNRSQRIGLLFLFGSAFGVTLLVHTPSMNPVEAIVPLIQFIVGAWLVVN